MPILSEYSKLSHPISHKQLRHKIFALPVGFSGCAFWRYRLPFAKLKKLGTCLDIGMADNASKTFRMAEIQEQVGDSELISIQSPGYKDALILMRVYHAEGKKVVIDYDDYSFDLSPGNPRYADLGIRETEQWKDGQNGFDLKANIAKFEAFKRCLGEADLVTTTTEYLANKFRPHSKNVIVCPNSVDFDIWKPIPRPEWMANEVRIGWFGGDSHFSDLEIFKSLLPRITKKYKNVKIVLQAPLVPEWRQFFRDIPQDQLEWHPWADLRYYTLFLAAKHWDIGLCPLEDSEFNKCKSAIKAFEFAAVGASVIAQKMSPYQEVINHGQNGLLASTEEEWFEAICKLIEDAGYRQSLQGNLYQDILRDHNLEKNCKIWEQAYVSCIEEASCG